MSYDGTRHFDAIVIGTGQAGGPLAGRLAQQGMRVAIVEREHVGGSCINYGCTPTKTLAAAARVAYLARRSADYGVHHDNLCIDMKAIRERKRRIVEEWREGSTKALTDQDGVELIRGEGRFRSPREVAVSPNDGSAEQVLSAERIFLNTGTRASIPPIDGIDEVGPLDNRSILELGEVPEHLIVLGGGYIGLEFAQMFRRFGATVTVLEAAPRLAMLEDEEISKAVREIFAEDGIQVRTNVTATRTHKDSAGTITVELDMHLGNERVTGSHLLVAVGRTPNTDRLNLDAAGVETDERGHVKVDERLQTAQPHIFALGDIKGGPAFTHVSYDDYRIVAGNLLDGADRTTKGRILPYAVFIDPQLAHVGLHEAEAREAGHEIRTATLPMSHVARAIETNETRGLMKATVDAKTDQILGATVLGIDGGELMSLLQVAMIGGVTATQLRNGMFAHPLLSESLNKLFGNLSEDKPPGN